MSDQTEQDGGAEALSAIKLSDAAQELLEGLTDTLQRLSPDCLPSDVIMALSLQLWFCLDELDQLDPDPNAEEGYAMSDAVKVLSRSLAAASAIAKKNSN